MKIICGYQNTKDNKEDLALTPYLFLVKMFGENIKVIGAGVCWLNYSVYIALSLGYTPMNKHFFNHSKKINS